MAQVQLRIKQVAGLEELISKLEKTISILEFSVKSNPPLEFHSAAPLIGAVDGTNVLFEIADKPVESSLHIYMNGSLLEKGHDYEVNGRYVMMKFSPLVGDRLRASYHTSSN